MRATRTTALGMWMLERLSIGAANEALAGDLLEQLHHGRTIAWFWEQVATAIAMAAAKRTADLAPAAAFSAAWSLLYPAWQRMSGGWLPREIPESWQALAWPRPALIELACGVLPAVAFVWLGILLYLVVRRGMLLGQSPLRILGGLSASLNVLLGCTILLLRHFHHPDLVYVTSAHFYFGYQFLGINLPLTLSVLSALLVADPRRPQLVRRRRVARQHITARIARLAQGAGHRFSLMAAPVRPIGLQ
jgi:hypothetical protein